MTVPPSEAGSAGTPPGLACGGTQRTAGERSDIKDGTANRMVKRARQHGEGSTPGGSLEGELSPGAAAVWEERGAAGLAAARAGDAPGAGAASPAERGCWRVPEHGPASLLRCLSL